MVVLLQANSNKENKRYADSVIFNSQGKVLLLLRQNEDTMFPGKWGLPGGKIEEGEESIDAAVRELEEEAGLISSKIQPIFVYLNIDEHVEISYFIVEPLVSVDNTVETLVRLNIEEHRSWEFVAREDLWRYDLIPGLEENLVRIFDQAFLHSEDTTPVLVVPTQQGEAQKFYNVQQFISSAATMMNDGDIEDATFLSLKKSFGKTNLLVKGLLQTKIVSNKEEAIIWSPSEHTII